MPPWFSVGRISMLDRGWTWALVHPRGGGELGRRWYTDGKLLAKRNTFTDTIACVEHIRDLGWAHPDRITVLNRGNYLTFKAIRDAEVPVVVAVHKFVIGGGIGICWRVV
jgi:hypothetical protein